MGARHAAWFLTGGRWSDPEHRYSTLYTWRVPPRDVPENVFQAFCCQDAYQAPSDASTALDRGWAEAVRANGWRLSKGGAYVGGWAEGRIAVDLGRPEPWTWLRANARTLAAQGGFSRIQWADVSLHPILEGVTELVDCGTWEAKAAAFQRAGCMPEDSLTGVKDWIAVRDAAPRTIKVELPRYNQPWDGRSGHPLSWRIWTFGRPDWGPGIKGLVRAGRTVVIDCFMPDGWSEARRAAHAAVLMATALLFDRVSLVLHGNSGDWYKHPFWYEACTWPDRLGEPVLPMAQWPDGSWQRQYRHGTVTVAGDGSNARVRWS